MVLLFLACNAKDSEPVETGLEPICVDHTAWTPGTSVFDNASEAWGLAESGVTGTLLSAVDFDGDGWTDLAVRDHGGGVWLLRNDDGNGFVDVTEDSGIRAARKSEDPRPGQVWAFADVDNDGDLDVYTGLPDDGSSDETSEILLNDGDGTFSLWTAGEVRVGSADSPAGAAFTDFDRDGHVDLWVAQSYGLGPVQDRLYRNDGDGTYTDVTFSVGLPTSNWSPIAAADGGSHTVAWSATACDLNNDGDPELMSSSYGRSPNHLWLNSGGQFTNHSVASGYAYDQRVDWSDNESARCYCKYNTQLAECEGVPSPQYIACTSAGDAFRWNHTYDREPGRLGGNSGGTVCRDVDGDGAMDLLTTEIVHWDVGSSSDPAELLFNDGSGTFERPGNEVTGLTREHDRIDWNDGDISASLFDFDLDGRTDVWIGSTDYPGARGLLWHNDGDRTFSAVDPADGIDHFRSHGSVVADFDHDGDLDLIVGHSGSRCDEECSDDRSVRFFENTSPPANTVHLTLEGTTANRSAIGARVEVRTDGVLQVAEVDGGHGHYGNQDDLTLTFGLGEACTAEVTVIWPDAERTTQTVELPAGYRFRMVQGEAPQRQ